MAWSSNDLGFHWSQCPWKKLKHAGEIAEAKEPKSYDDVNIVMGATWAMEIVDVSSHHPRMIQTRCWKRDDNIVFQVASKAQGTANHNCRDSHTYKMKQSPTVSVYAIDSKICEGRKVGD